MLVLAMQFSKGASVVSTELVNSSGLCDGTGDALSLSTELSSRRRGGVDRREERVQCTPSKRNRGRRDRSVDGGEPESSIRRRHHAAE
jgi:hypothetical protein